MEALCHQRPVLFSQQEGFFVSPGAADAPDCRAVCLDALCGAAFEECLALLGLLRKNVIVVPFPPLLKCCQPRSGPL